MSYPCVFSCLIFLEKLPKNISAETDLSPRAKATKDYIATDSNELNFKVSIIYDCSISLLHFKPSR